MEDWKVLYASKLMTADEAVRQIPDEIGRAHV